jgi:hypothetical protein
MGLNLVAIHPGIPVGLLTLGQLDGRIAINVSLPLVNSGQVSEATIYDTGGHDAAFRRPSPAVRAVHA